ncbi:MAG: hypothetical protein EU551_03485 [Promethearchaeota archaeon]|nr:MAG: hypothetical protein EU551_03485 [Candidatus Lokiarchaeota archaeon]
MSRKIKKVKKTPKHINIESRQENYIKKRFGKEVNFSEIIRKMIKLCITLLDKEIITDIEDETIDKLTANLYNIDMQEKMEKIKVLEYKEVFEDLSKWGRYYLADLSKFPKTLFTLIDFFLQLDYDENKYRPEYWNLVKKIASNSKMIDTIEVFRRPTDEYDLYLYITGENPNTFLWYIKEASCVLTGTQSHWEVVKIIPDIHPISNLKELKIYFKKGKSKEQSMKKLEEIFCNIKNKIIDDENFGIWLQLNTPYNFILDLNTLSYIKSNSEEQLIPFKESIEKIKNIAEDKNEITELILGFYEKIHLISDLSSSKNGKFKFKTLDDFVTDMILKTCDYLKIKCEFEKAPYDIINLKIVD